MSSILENAPKPHIPGKLPIKDMTFIYNPQTIKLISEANKAIGEYNGYLAGVPSSGILVAPLINQEAALSSKLEGTHSTVEDLLEYSAGNKGGIEEDDVRELINYRNALYHALDKMLRHDEVDADKIPFSNRLIREMHARLMNGVRGANKSPGKFKTTQNYIGSAERVSFTPLPAELTEEYMGDFENYFHYEEFDALIQASIMHAQFEMIHPFNDGNGRLGRLMIPLFLYERQILTTPTFYMSAYFERDRALYLQRLSNISMNDDWLGWIEYFLIGVKEQSQVNIEKAQKMLALYDLSKEMFLKEIQSPYIIPILDFIFEHPIFTKKMLQKTLDNRSTTTVNKLVNQLVDLGVLEHNDKQRNTTFYFMHLLKIM
jgi:Fic family protein